MLSIYMSKLAASNASIVRRHAHHTQSERE
jgi:hypothetical protein